MTVTNQLLIIMTFKKSSYIEKIRGLVNQESYYSEAN
jgi:hypothetical protein